MTCQELLAFRSFRNVAGNYDVLIRADDDPNAAFCFEHEGKKFDVVVALNTNTRRIAISITKELSDREALMKAGYLAYWCWEVGRTDEDTLSFSPEGKQMYINDARLAAEIIAARMEKLRKEGP